jgi:hypothetical protein
MNVAQHPRHDVKVSRRRGSENRNRRAASRAMTMRHSVARRGLGDAARCVSDPDRLGSSPRYRASVTVRLKTSRRGGVGIDAEVPLPLELETAPRRAAARLGSRRQSSRTVSASGLSAPSQSGLGSRP